MKIVKSDLSSAAESGIISSTQAENLWKYLEALRPDQPKFQGLHVLYYFGGILILSSMSWFLTTAWKSGGAVMAISGLFALMYLIVGRRLWNSGLKIPGGLLVTAAVGLTPVFIYGFQKVTGLWLKGAPGEYRNYYTWLKGSWFFMEAGTVIAAVIALRFFKFTFITFPLALSLWCMSMDLAPLLFGKSEFTWDERKTVSCVFGFIMLVASYFIDRKFKKTDFAFWTFIYGMLAFWGGLTAMDSRNEFNRFIYCIINVGFIFVSVYLRRRVFLVFGTIGVMIYVGHLAWEIFKNSYAFPIVLALLGMGFVILGVQYQKNKEKIEGALEKQIPSFLLRWRPDERV